MILKREKFNQSLPPLPPLLSDSADHFVRHIFTQTGSNTAWIEQTTHDFYHWSIVASAETLKGAMANHTGLLAGLGTISSTFGPTVSSPSDIHLLNPLASFKPLLKFHCLSRPTLTISFVVTCPICLIYFAFAFFYSSHYLHDLFILFVPLDRI